MSERCMYCGSSQCDHNEQVRLAMTDREMVRHLQKKVCLLLNKLEDHEIHIEEKWCWCHPSIENHSHIGKGAQAMKLVPHDNKCEMKQDFHFLCKCEERRLRTIVAKQDAEVERLRERVRIADSLVSEKSVELALELSIANTRLAEANAAFEAEQTEKWEMAARLAEAERDAARYRFLRERLEVRQQEAMDGTFRNGLSVRIGCTFLDSEVSKRRSLTDPDAHENGCKKFDADIDAFLVEKQP